MNRHALIRLLKGADPLEVFEAAREIREPEPDADVPPVPDDPVEFVRDWVYWPHIEEVDAFGPRPVNGLNPMQADYLEHRTAFRLDESGQVVPGSDSIMKSRRIRFTSLCFGLILWACCRLPGTRYVSVFQTAKRSIIDEAIGQVLFAVERLPPEWVGLSSGRPAASLRVGARLKINGCRWDFETAGHSKRVAGQLARGGRLDGLHLSEPRAYAEPEEVWASAGKAIKNGWVIAESNPPTNREQWHAREWQLSKEGVGSFRRAFFWPWHHDPLKRLRRGTPGFEAMHSDKFLATLPADALRAEDRLGLDDEQKAFRRREYYTGTARQRAVNKAENPEAVEDAFIDAGSSWLDPGALELCRAMCADPVYRQRLGTLFSVSCWMVPEDFQASGEMLVMFCDTAVKSGQDRSAIRVRTGMTRRVVAEVHGRALASELADAVVWLIERYVGSVKRQRAYCVAVERNAGTGKDLLELLQSRGLRTGTRNGLFAEHVKDTRPGKPSHATRLRPGIYTGASNRAQYLDRISEAVEGRGWEDGEPVPLGPTVEFRSQYLVEELAALREHEGMIQAPPGSLDDLAIADGGCLLICSKVGGAVTAPAFSVGRPGDPNTRTVKRRTARRRRVPT